MVRVEAAAGGAATRQDGIDIYSGNNMPSLPNMKRAGIDHDPQILGANQERRVFD